MPRVRRSPTGRINRPASRQNRRHAGRLFARRRFFDVGNSCQQAKATSARCLGREVDTEDHQQGSSSILKLPSAFAGTLSKPASISICPMNFAACFTLGFAFCYPVGSSLGVLRLLRRHLVRAADVIQNRNNIYLSLRPFSKTIVKRCSYQHLPSTRETIIPIVPTLGDVMYEGDPVFTRKDPFFVDTGIVRP